MPFATLSAPDPVTDTQDHSRLITWTWLLAAASGVTVTIAFASAQVFVTRWRGATASRLAMLPSWRWGVAGAVLALSVFGGAAWFATGRGRSLADVAKRVRPFAWLLVLAVPLLPLLGDLCPAFTALAGPLRWLVGLAAVGAYLADTTRGAWRGLIHLNPRPFSLFAIAFAVYAVAGLWVTRVQGVAGDEPHYLIITESLLRDRDLQIENNHERGDYRRYFDGPPLEPDFIRRGVNGVIYSIHAPGLPALVLPAYAVGGRVGVNVFLGGVAALAASAVFLLARALAGPGPALITWLGIAFGTPFLMHGWLIFPEMPAACIVAWALYWTWQELPTGMRPWIWRGMAVAFLPWLHAKFVVLLMGLALVLSWRVIRRPLMLVSFAMPIALSLAGWFYSFYAMYGVADPTIPYGGAAMQGYQSTWANVPRGLLGLVFDQEFGLLLYSPVYLVALAGLSTVIRRRDARYVVAAVSLAGGAFLLGITRYYMWWGGWSVPGRFALPFLVMLAPFLAAGVGKLADAASGRVFVAVTLGATLVVSLLLVSRPERPWLFNDRDGTGNLLGFLQGHGPLTSMFPSLFGEDWVAQLPRIAAVTAGFLIGALVLWALGRRARDPDVEGTLVMPFVTATFTAVALLCTATSTRATRTEVTRNGQLELMNAWNGRDVLDVSRVKRVTPAALVARLRVPLFSAPGELPGEDRPLEWLGPWPLPAGTFKLRAALRPAGRAEGELVAWFHRTGAVADRADVNGRSTAELTVIVSPAIAFPPLWLGASSRAVAEQVTGVELVPVEIIPARSESLPSPRALETIEGPSGAYLAYLDRNAFPEGGVFWTKGESEAELLVITAGARTLHVQAAAGASRGPATIAVEGVPTTLELAAHQTRSFDVALVPSQATARVRVAFPAGFRPSAVEQGSRDTRWLGVRVRLSLE